MSEIAVRYGTKPRCSSSTGYAACFYRRGTTAKWLVSRVKSDVEATIQPSVKKTVGAPRRIFAPTAYGVDIFFPACFSYFWAFSSELQYYCCTVDHTANVRELDAVTIDIFDWTDSWVRVIRELGLTLQL